jgi:hypothetical protein
MSGYDDDKFLKGPTGPNFSAQEITAIVTSTGTASISAGYSATSLLSQYTPVKPADDHKIYSFVGRVASDWAHVEHLFDEIIWHLSGTDSIRGASITAQMLGVYPRCRAIMALLTTTGKRRSLDVQWLITKTNELMQKSSDLSDKRNRIVHDPWYVYTGLDQTAQFKAMPHKDLRYGIHPVDFTELSATLIAIKNYSERVTRLRDDVYSALKA